MAEIGAVCPDKVSSPERAKTFQSFTLQSSDPVASVRESVLKQELLMLPRCPEQTRMILPVSVLNIFEVPSKQPVASKCPLRCGLAKERRRRPTRCSGAPHGTYSAYYTYIIQHACIVWYI